MYFLLLQGVHLEHSKKFQAETERDEQGLLRIKSRPVVKSKKDLVLAFGPEKFRRISGEEAKALLQADGLEAGQQDSVSATQTESEVAKVVKEGAVAIAEPPGVDLTGKFPELSEWPTITVYFKRGKGYYIADGDKVITEAPIKRSDVVMWVQNYKEG